MMIAEDADFQAKLRANRDLISTLVEDALRYESPVRGDVRLSKVPVTVGGVDLRAGTTVLLVNAAITHDLCGCPYPDTFDIQRAGSGP